MTLPARLLISSLLLFASFVGSRSEARAASLVIQSVSGEACPEETSGGPTDSAEAALSVEEIMLAGDRELDLAKLERPAGWLLSAKDGRSVLRQVAKCAPPLDVPISGDWVRVRLSELSQSAKLRLGDASRWVERRPAGDASPTIVELGARAPSHEWKSPRWVPYQRSLTNVPALVEPTSQRPRRLVFDEARSLDPTPVLPAASVELPSTVEFPDLFIPRGATLRVGLDGDKKGNVTLEVETVSATGPHRVTKRVPVAPNPREPVWVELPLKNSQPIRGDLRLRISAEDEMSLRLVDPKLRGSRPTGPARDEKPNVILITLDTVRADHLSIYGYARSTTPFLESISNELLIFDNAYSQVPSTRPSHYSILSSRYPHDLGIWSNDGPPLPNSELTLPEVMRSAGWRTGAVLSVDFLMLRSGLDQGFDTVNRPHRQGERLGEGTTEAAIDFIEQNSNSPFFLWLHYFDAHLPYQPLPKYRGLFWEGPPPKDVDIEPHLIEKEGLGTIEAVPHRGYMTAMYDASLRYLDDQIRSLYDYLAAADLLEQTIIVIAADHGESLGENGVYFAHDGLHEPTVRVPLMLRLPDRRRSGRVDDVVENLDIAATVLDSVGLKTPASFRGSTLLAEGPGDNQAIFEHTGQYFVGIRRGSLKWIDASHFKSQERFARTNLRELHRGPAISLFDLDADPMERTNLAGSHPKETEELRSTIDRSLEGAGKGSPRHPEAQPVDPALRESLRALGYVE